MKRVLVLLAALAPLLAAADDEPSAEVKAFLERWSAGMADVRTLRVEFTQTKRLRILRKPLVSSGRTLLKGRVVRMVVEGKDGEVQTELRVEPGEARLHYPKLKRVEVIPLGEGAAPPTPFPLFGADLEQLPRAYALSLERDERGREVLVMVPRDAQSPIKETRMRFEGTEVRAVTQVTRRGDRMELEVTRFERNVEVPDAALELNVPPGTEVVRVAPAGG